MHLGKKSSPRVRDYSFYGQVRKKRILETIAAFVGGGIASVEFVHHILVNHYHFPKYSVDLTIAVLFVGMVSTISWRWFRFGKKQATNVSKGETVSSKYRIIKELGQGGMGVVYRARDLLLDRFVALKFLPLKLTRDPEARKRFVKEAQASASLDHPNICTVHEIGEHEGQTYIAMACLEGKTLKDKIASGPLNAEEAISVGLETAEGLAEAHSHGIIHRDIKPANIMLTKKGQVRIMDFGLAKLSWGAARCYFLFICADPFCRIFELENILLSCP